MMSAPQRASNGELVARHADDSMSIDWTLNMRRKCCRFFSSSKLNANSASSSGSGETGAGVGLRKLEVGVGVCGRREIISIDDICVQEQASRVFQSDAASRAGGEVAPAEAAAVAAAETARRSADSLSALSASSSLLSQLLNSSLNQLIEIDNGSSSSAASCERRQQKQKQQEEQQQQHRSLDERDLRLVCSASWKTAAASQRQGGRCAISADSLAAWPRGRCERELGRPRQVELEVEAEAEAEARERRRRHQFRRRHCASLSERRPREARCRPDSQSAANSARPSPAPPPPPPPQTRAAPREAPGELVGGGRPDCPRRAGNNASRAGQQFGPDERGEWAHSGSRQQKRPEQRQGEPHSAASPSGELDARQRIGMGTATPNKLAQQEASQSCPPQAEQLINAANNQLQQHDSLLEVSQFIVSQLREECLDSSDFQCCPFCLQFDTGAFGRQQQFAGVSAPIGIGAASIGGGSSDSTCACLFGAQTKTASGELAKQSGKSTRHATQPSISSNLSSASTSSGSSCGVRVTTSDSSEHSSPQTERQPAPRNQSGRAQEASKQLEGRLSLSTGGLELAMGLAGSAPRKELQGSERGGRQRQQRLEWERPACRQCELDGARSPAEGQLEPAGAAEDFDWLLSGAYAHLKSQLLAQKSPINFASDPNNNLVLPLTQTEPAASKSASLAEAEGEEPMFSLDPRALVGPAARRRMGQTQRAAGCEDSDQASMVEATAKFARVVGSDCPSQASGSSISSSASSLKRLREAMMAARKVAPSWPQVVEPIYDIPARSPADCQASGAQRKETLASGAKYAPLVAAFGSGGGGQRVALVRCLSPDQKYPPSSGGGRRQLDRISEWSRADSAEEWRLAQDRVTDSRQTAASKVGRWQRAKGCRCAECARLAASKAAHLGAGRAGERRPKRLSRPPIARLDSTEPSCSLSLLSRVALHGSGLRVCNTVDSRGGSARKESRSQLRRRPPPVLAKLPSASTTNSSASCCSSCCSLASTIVYFGRRNLIIKGSTSSSCCGSSESCSCCCSRSNCCATIGDDEFESSADERQSSLGADTPGSLSQEYLRRHRLSGRRRRRWRRRSHGGRARFARLAPSGRAERRRHLRHRRRHQRGQYQVAFGAQLGRSSRRALRSLIEGRHANKSVHLDGSATFPEESLLPLVLKSSRELRSNSATSSNSSSLNSNQTRRSKAIKAASSRRPKTGCPDSSLLPRKSSAVDKCGRHGRLANLAKLNYNRLAEIHSDSCESELADGPSGRLFATSSCNGDQAGGQHSHSKANGLTENLNDEPLSHSDPDPDPDLSNEGRATFAKSCANLAANGKDSACASATREAKRANMESQMGDNYGHSQQVVAMAAAAAAQTIPVGPSCETNEPRQAPGKRVSRAQGKGREWLPLGAGVGRKRDQLSGRPCGRNGEESRFVEAAAAATGERRRRRLRLRTRPRSRRRLQAAESERTSRSDMRRGSNYRHHLRGYNHRRQRANLASPLQGRRSAPSSSCSCHVHRRRRRLLLHWRRHRRYNRGDRHTGFSRHHRRRRSCHCKALRPRLKLDHYDDPLQASLNLRDPRLQQYQLAELRQRKLIRLLRKQHELKQLNSPAKSTPSDAARIAAGAKGGGREEVGRSLSFDRMLLKAAMRGHGVSARKAFPLREVGRRGSCTSSSLPTSLCSRNWRHYKRRDRNSATMKLLRSMQRALINQNSKTSFPRLVEAERKERDRLMDKFLVKSMLPKQSSISTSNLFQWQLARRCQCSHCCLVEKFIQMDAESKRKRKLAQTIMSSNLSL